MVSFTGIRRLNGCLHFSEVIDSQELNKFEIYQKSKDDLINWFQQMQFTLTSNTDENNEDKILDQEEEQMHREKIICEIKELLKIFIYLMF